MPWGRRGNMLGGEYDVPEFIGVTKKYECKTEEGVPWLPDPLICLLFTAMG